VGRFTNYIYWLIAFINTFFVTKIVVHSKYYHNKLQTLPFYKFKTHYVPLPPYGFDVICDVPLSNHIMDNNDIRLDDYFIFLGRLEYYKGLHNIMDTFKNLADRNLLIAGPGESYYVKLLFKKKMHHPNIAILTGYLAEADFIYLLSHAKCLIMPYLHASQSVLPYIAASLSIPIISSSSTGISSLVADLNGYIYSTEQELVSLLKTDNLRPTSYDEKMHLEEFINLMYKVV
jgi:glycosyltransferase involved in cell wall biosynthesis